MIVSFSTKYGHLSMHGESAVTLLRLMGHSGNVPGAILAAYLPASLARLREGLDAHGDEPSPGPDQHPVVADRESDEREKEPPVRLRTRAVPLLDMIETAIKRDSDLMWDRL
jgi:hypothetical protein